MKKGTLYVCEVRNERIREMTGYLTNLPSFSDLLGIIKKSEIPSFYLPWLCLNDANFICFRGWACQYTKAAYQIDEVKKIMQETDAKSFSDEGIQERILALPQPDNKKRADVICDLVEGKHNKDILLPENIEKRKIEIESILDVITVEHEELYKILEEKYEIVRKEI